MKQHSTYISEFIGIVYSELIIAYLLFFLVFPETKPRARFKASEGTSQKIIRFRNPKPNHIWFATGLGVWFIITNRIKEGFSYLTL